jgi:predicted GIY-YIG superfamily endonuclease
LPVRVVYREVAGDRGAALKREHAIKTLPRAAKQALCKRRKRAAGSRAVGQLMTEKRRPSGKMIAFKK